MAMNEPQSAAGDQAAHDARASAQPEHDQDSDPPRTAVPPDSPSTPGEPTSTDPTRDPDSDPPRTPVI
jgi:hypothetical protein